MIYCKKKDIIRYRGLSKDFDTAIEYLLSADLTKLVKGRNVVDGSNVFINRFDYMTMPAEKAIWEGHIEYADIHVLLSGHEKIGVSDISLLSETTRDVEKDFVGYEGPVQTWFNMTTEDLLIVFPEDVHLVKVIDSESVLVEKACFKVKV